MNSETLSYIKNNFGVDADIVDAAEEAEKELAHVYSELDEIMEYNQYKVLNEFQKARINDQHFAWNTGYGYDDIGRAALEQLYANVFGAEAGLVRPTIVNGTHALASVYFGLLRPGDELIYCTGDPYDTMQTVIGIKGSAAGNLKEFGVVYRQVDLLPDNSIDIEAVKKAIGPSTKVVSVQRSRGYSFRNAFSIAQIGAWAKACKEVKPDVICMVDNCYGEFTDIVEPVQAGADIMAGSLIKNPGGGIAVSGGYVVGRKILVDMVANRVTCPGIGGECGLTFGQTRSMFQGLFIAPRVTNGALKGAALCAKVFRKLGYEVCPGPEDPRNDIVQAVKLDSPEAVCAFCEGVQAAAPIDAFVKPIPWDMPGYADRVIMAAGAFIGGSSIELSADAPMRKPYTVYFQGGITYEHSKFGVMKALQAIKDAGLLK